MTPRIFISYRRDDVEGFAGRLYDKLVLDIGKNNIFMDIDSVPFGVNFLDVIQDALSQCNVCIVLIGATWLSSSDHKGRKRIDDPTDFVRLEIEHALETETLVVPVLLQGTSMPRPDQLPPSLQSLSYLNALKVGEQFHPEFDRLLEQLKKGTGIVKKRGERGSREPRGAAAAITPGRTAPEKISRVAARRKTKKGEILREGRDIEGVEVTIDGVLEFKSGTVLTLAQRSSDFRDDIAVRIGISSEIFKRYFGLFDYENSNQLSGEACQDVHAYFGDSKPAVYVDFRTPSDREVHPTDKQIESDYGRLIHIIKAVDQGHDAWYIVLVRKECEEYFLANIENVNIPLDRYGRVLDRGWGAEPPSNVIEKLVDEWVGT